MENLLETLQFFLDLLWTLLQFFLIIWPVWVVVGILWALRIAFKLYEYYRLSKSGMTEIDKMGGKDFEKYLAMLFKKLGYKAKRTPYRGDYGADLIIQKAGEKIVVQAKRYKQKVGIKAIQEAVAAKDYYQCNQAMVVTNSQYTPQAIQLAQANKVELWDRKKLTAVLLGIKKGAGVNSTKSGLPVEIEAGATRQGLSSTRWTDNVCEICQKPISERVKEYCLAREEIFGGKVYCFEHQKDIRSKHKAPSKQKSA